MKQSMSRILTTHVGSLPRPHGLLEMMRLKFGSEGSQSVDDDAYQNEVRKAVKDIVRKQAEVGIDVVTDGEMSKTGFFTYANERLTGLTPNPGIKFDLFPSEVQAFPEYYKEYFQQAMIGGTVLKFVPMACTGPVRYRGQDAMRKDIDNLKAALKDIPCEDVFMPSTAPPLGIVRNDHYKTEEEFAFALADAMGVEYRAIVDAGFNVQIDDPILADMFSYSKADDAGKHKTGMMYVEAINHALKGIPPEKVRFHTCYGINEGPRIHDAPLDVFINDMLKVNAVAFSFEAANPRHEHVYHLFEKVKLPQGKILIPGVITHASNIVEHPDYIAERIARFAKLVGRENVMAGADCGFSSQATFRPEVHVSVVWAKFRAMTEGARIASKALWGN